MARRGCAPVGASRLCGVSGGDLRPLRWRADRRGMCGVRDTCQPGLAWVGLAGTALALEHRKRGCAGNMWQPIGAQVGRDFVIRAWVIVDDELFFPTLPSPPPRSDRRDVSLWSPWPPAGPHSVPKASSFRYALFHLFRLQPPGHRSLSPPGL